MRVDLIDNFRAMAMMYVIFIHAMFWLGLFPFAGDYSTFFLIEMPLFFIVTGMAHTFARTDDLIKFYISRAKRLLIPFWIFAFICASANLLFGMSENIYPKNLSIVKEIFSEWLNPFGTMPSKILFLNFATWFIPVYLLIMVIIPFLKRLSNLRGGVWKIISLVPLFAIPLLVFIFQQYITVSDLIKQVTFYSFWVYAGFFLHDIKNIEFKIKLPYCISLIIFSVIMMFVLHNNFGVGFNMQANKFPPNAMFLFFNLAMMSILFLFCKPLNDFLNFISSAPYLGKVFKTYRDFCYTVYLYHPFAFFILLKIVEKLEIAPTLHEHTLLTLIIVVPLLIVSASIIAGIFSRFENLWRVKKVNHNEI